MVAIGAEGFNEDMLEAVIGTEFGVFDQVSEELLHVGLKDISEVDGVVDLGEDEHEVLKVSLFVGLLV